MYVKWQGRPSASAEPDDDMGGEYAYVWGTNVNIPDVLRAIRRFLNNYRSTAGDLHSKYIQLIEEVGNLSLVCAWKWSFHVRHSVDAIWRVQKLQRLICWWPHDDIRLWSEKRIL